MGMAHEVEILSLDDAVLNLRVDGSVYAVDLARESERLAKATQEQRAQIIVSPSGYGLHGPMVDEDLSIDGLIGVRHTPPLMQSGPRT